MVGRVLTTTMTTRLVNFGEKSTDHLACEKYVIIGALLEA